MSKPIHTAGPYLSLDQQARMEFPLRLSPQEQEDIHRADVVITVDAEADYRQVVYGQDRLERIVATGQPESVTMKLCPVKSRTNQVECLMAFVEVIKGKRGVKIGHYRV